jgi:hypothetical protein
LVVLHRNAEEDYGKSVVLMPEPWVDGKSGGPSPLPRALSGKLYLPALPSFSLPFYLFLDCSYEA